jgi:putative transcriptional regulator
MSVCVSVESLLMPIKWRLAAVMADREMDYKQLAEVAGLHPVTVNKLKNTYEMPSRLDRGTLLKLCRSLHCQPGDLLRYAPDEADEV